MEICILNVCYCSVSKMSLTLCDPMDLQHTRASLSFTVSWNLLTLMSIESMMPSNHLILCHPLLFLSSIFPSIRVFSSESTLYVRPKYWSFSISPSSEYPGLISFWMNWFHLLAVQRTLSLFGSILTSIHDYWKIHSFDYMDLCR